MAQEVIRLQDISRKFVIGKVIIPALKGVTLNVKKNEYVALMGPSGSGKSTLMNILGCLDTPSGGEYFLNGTDVSKMRDNELAVIRNKEIGFVFQTFNLMPRLTALENVALPLVYMGKNRNGFRAWILCPAFSKKQMLPKPRYFYTDHRIMYWTNCKKK